MRSEDYGDEVGCVERIDGVVFGAKGVEGNPSPQMYIEEISERQKRPALLRELRPVLLLRALPRA